MRGLFIFLVVAVSLFAFVIYCPHCINITSIYFIMGYAALAFACVVTLDFCLRCVVVWLVLLVLVVFLCVRALTR